MRGISLKALPSFAVALLLLLPLSSFVAAAGAAQERGGGQLTEEVQLTRPLAADGRVSLRNISGSVRVSVWDRNEVRVAATKRAPSQKRLDEAEVDVVATADSVSIRTVYTTNDYRYERGSRDNSASVDYSLTVPRAARLDSIELVNGPLEVEGLAGEIRAACVNGALVARNLSGPARLSTVNGRLDASFAQLSAGTVSLGSVNGLLTVTLPSDADASLRASTVHGTILNDLGLAVRRGQFTGASLAGVLGGGAARLRLDNVNGAIHIRRASDGRAPSAVRAADGGHAGR